MEVLSWTKPVKHKNDIGHYDDNIGKDSLSSQSTYVQDIEDEEYLQCLCPSPRFLATDSVTDNIELRDVYASLFKAVYDVCVNKSFLRGLNEENKSVDTYIVELHALLVVNCHDDIEFYEWAHANTSHVIWSCHDIFKSPILESAMKKLTKKSSNSEAASNLLSDKDRNRQYHFIGFVASHVKGNNIQLGFHPSSFVIYYVDGQFHNTVVVFTMTSRHHISSNMQDRLLQLVQIIQYVQFQNHVNFNMIITNECVHDVTINYDSRLAYESLGFDTSSLTQDCNTIGAFGIQSDDPIPIVQYGDHYTWAKYGYHVLPPDIKCSCRNGEIKGYRQAIRCLLRTDLYQMDYFQIEIHTHSEV